ncbi:MAG: orotidine-5'-phosphate decarboxylase [Oscillospiraceae bacterium]|nr:orotidine-5'-phosphate decarboxylase [Oscillospiraceae bacterium]
MINAADRLAQAIARTSNPTAMGLDTQVTHLPAEFKPLTDSVADICAAIYKYNCALIEGMADLVGCIKVQAAYYEMYGVEGMKTFAKTLSYAREKGYVTIADCKRNDIGATAGAYAKAYLDPKGEFFCDFVTVNGYLGVDGIKPFVDLGKETGCGIYALVKTSNPSGAQLQDMVAADGRKIYEVMADFVSEWGTDVIGECGYSSVGAVVGATWPQQSTELRKRMPHTPFLVPGYGAQGGTGKDLAGCFDANGGGAVVNASRSLLCAHQKRPEMGWLEAVRAEAVRMRADITAKY